MENVLNGSVRFSGDYPLYLWHRLAEIGRDIEKDEVTVRVRLWFGTDDPYTSASRYGLTSSVQINVGSQTKKLALGDYDIASSWLDIGTADFVISGDGSKHKEVPFSYSCTIGTVSGYDIGSASFAGKYVVRMIGSGSVPVANDKGTRLLRLYNPKGELIDAIGLRKDYSIKSELATGDKVLRLAVPAGRYEMKREGYIEAEGQRYVIKLVRTGDVWESVEAVLDVEGITSQAFPKFEAKEKTPGEIMAQAFAGTGWTIGRCDITTKNTISGIGMTGWDVLQEMVEVFDAEISIDTGRKRIDFMKQIGQDKGSYLKRGMNLRAMTVEQDSYSFFTRLYAYGKDGVSFGSINGGKEYVENFTYTDKVVARIWKDERYTIKENLYAAAVKKVKEASDPTPSYECDVVDIAAMSDRHKPIDYQVGDHLILADTDEKVTVRVTEMEVYPDEPTRNRVVLGKKRSSISDMRRNVTSRIDIAQESAIEGKQAANAVQESLRQEAEAIRTQLVDGFAAADSKAQGKMDSLHSQIGQEIADAEVRARKLVTDLDELVLKKSEIKQTAEGVEIGTGAIIDGEKVASMIALRPEYVAIIAKLLQIKGDMIVDGAVSANKLAANAVRAGAIEAGAVTAEKVTIDAAFIEKLKTDNAFIRLLETSRLVAGKIQSADGSSWWDLDTGEVHLMSGEIEGIETQIDTLARQYEAEEERSKKTADDMRDLTKSFSSLQTDYAAVKEQAEKTGSLEATQIELKDKIRELKEAAAQVGAHMSFDDKGLTIGREGSRFKVQIDDDQIAFFDGDAKVAYISNNRLFITSGVFVSSLEVGNHKIEKMDGSNEWTIISWTGGTI